MQSTTSRTEVPAIVVVDADRPGCVNVPGRKIVQFQQAIPTSHPIESKKVVCPRGGETEKRILFFRFEAGISMKTKETWTECPMKSRTFMPM